MANQAFSHQPGTAIECLSIPITLHKEDSKCGFKIGGGIDQDYRKSPQGYEDNGIYVTEVRRHCTQHATSALPQMVEDSAASRAGLRVYDKILQLNGYDFTMVTHKKAVDYIKKLPALNMLVARKGVTQT